MLVLKIRVPTPPGKSDMFEVNLWIFLKFQDLESPG